MAQDATPDVELLAAWRGGDKAAGGALLRRHFPAVFRYFDRHVQGADVEDLTQRTFEACIQTRDRLREDSSFRPYLFGVARKQLLKHYERKYPRGRQVPPSEVELRDIRTSPTGLMARAEQQRLFLRALDAVPEPYREALDLFFWQDRKLVEMATMLDIALGTVKSRLHRGKAMLKEQLDAMQIEQQSRAELLSDLNSRPVEPA